MVTRRPTPPSRASRGFTLVEVLIALAVMAIGMVGVLALQKTAVESSGYSRRATEAAVLAEDRLEQFRTAPLPSSPPFNGADTVDASGVADADAPYRRVWTIAWNGDIATVTVTVRWDESDGEHAITLDTQRLR